MEVHEAVIELLTKALDDLVGACLDASGRIKAPDRRSVIMARRLLPEGSAHTLIVKHREEDG